MPVLAIVVEILETQIHDIGCFDTLTGSECLLDHASGFQVAHLDPVECLPLAGFDEFVFDDGIWIAIKHDFQSTTEFVGIVGCHLDLEKSDKQL